MTVKEYRSWQERLTAQGATGSEVLPDRIRYKRKSTESVERQVASLEQQGDKMDKEWSAIDPVWVWEDSFTGTTFDRPGFQDMLAFCRANRRPKKSPGRIEMYDPSRFGRILDEDGEPDVMKFYSVFSEFESYNWRIEFVTVKRTGDSLIDIIMIALYAYAAALFSANLSRSVRRGRVSHAASGWWVSGSAPWGTKRKDTKAGRILKDREPSSPGGGGTILVPDSRTLKVWKEAAKRILGGASLDSVGAMLFEKGLSGPRGGRLGHSSIRNFLTNIALIGMVEYLDESDTTKDGARERRQVKAKWEPMVDVELFHQLAKRLGVHTRSNPERRRRQRALFPITPVCAHCGGRYIGGRLSKDQGGMRQYAHAKPKERMDEEARKAFDEAKCKVWYVDSLELESKIKDLIVRQRGSKEFEDEVRSLILERDDFRKKAHEAVAAAKQRLAEREAEYKRLVRVAHAVISGPDGDSEAEDEDVLVTRLTALRQAVKAAKAEVDEAERFAQSRHNAWERLSGIIHETRNLAKTWNKLSPEERKILLDYWVVDVMIVVEPVPGKKRANRKTALVTLRTAPGTPVALELGRGQSSNESSADRSAASTDSSDSTSACACTAAIAAGEPSLASARAADARTSGVGSSSAEASADTASGESVLPSTAAALRLSPESFARFIGDPLNAAENSGCDIESNSSASVCASLPANTDLGANASSDSSRANLWLYGQTS